MPTMPSRKKNKLDAAVEASTYRKKPISHRRAVLAGILGIFFGWYGIHDIMLRHGKRAFVHIVSSTIAFSMFFIPFIYGMSVVYACMHGQECIDISDYDDMLNVILIAGLILFCLNIIWGAVEGIILLANHRRFPNSR